MKMAEEICQRFRMSNDDTEQIVTLVANHMKFPDGPESSRAIIPAVVDSSLEPDTRPLTASLLVLGALALLGPPLLRLLRRPGE